MSQPAAYAALAAGLISAFGASVYLGVMLVVQFFLRPLFLGLRLEELATVFAGPITRATRFFVALFVPLLAAAVVQIWLSIQRPLPLVLAFGCALSYVFLAVWFAAAMRPINQRLITGAMETQEQLNTQMALWLRRNWARLGAAAVYWVCAVAFLLLGRELWKDLM